MWSYGSTATSLSSSLPDTSFPGLNETAKNTLLDALSTVLVISDPNEVNENFSIFIKSILDNVYMLDEENDAFASQKTYQTISKYSLKLLTSNMFIKNYQFCVGKILTLLSAFTHLTEQNINGECKNERVLYQGECLKEFLCIALLLLLKLKNSKESDSDTDSERLEMIDKNQLFIALAKSDFVPIMGRFISAHIISTNLKLTSFVLLKFSCDIFFEFLYYREVFDDSDFDQLVNSRLVTTTITSLLTARENYGYDVDGDTYEDEDKLVAYEQLKLLLLINEQFLIKSYTSTIKNRVMQVLLTDENGKKNNTKMVTFINLLIYHLNREESQIIKILILKFLNSIFTKSETSDLVYLNDLKILVDIFIRELNDLDYDRCDDTRILVIDYLRVLYPLLVNTQLAKCMNYKSQQILEVLSHLVSTSQTSHTKDNMKAQEDVIVKLATKCMGIDWLNPKKREKVHTAYRVPSDLSEVSDIGAAFTRIASVRTSTRADYHRQTAKHNLNRTDTINSITSSDIAAALKENNHNLFLDNFETLKIKAQSLETKWGELDQTEKTEQLDKNSNLLDLPAEYLNSKPLPSIDLPENVRDAVYSNDNSSTSSINSVSLLVRKAMAKKAPPPPATPNRAESLATKNALTPPLPPPPRRRRA